VRARFFSIILAVGFSFPVTAAVTGTDVFLTAFQAADYRGALAAAERLRDDPLAPVYRATCLALLERNEEAVELFRRAAPGTGSFAQVALFAQAQALYNLRCYARAQGEMDRLVRRFPHGRFAERGQDMAMRIERRLAGGLTQANLEWYQDRGLAAYDQARSGLAAEYLEEYRLLAQRMGAAIEPKAMLTLAAVALEMDDRVLTETSIALVPPATEDWRGALYRGLAHLAAGRTADARADLEQARTHSTDATVRKRAAELIVELDAPAAATPSAPVRTKASGR
jgi:hypothetical protein